VGDERRAPSEMFNDYWKRDRGFLGTVRRGDLSDLITRSAETGAVVTLGPDDAVLTADWRIELHDLCQLPLLDDAQIVGMLDGSAVRSATS
jgi:cystathionine beta-synthase